MKTLLLLLTTFACATGAVQAQGTFVYDQESSNDETYPNGGPTIQFYGSVGQSFTPSLSTVGFFRVKVDDTFPRNALGATLVGTLRSGAINGPIIGTTMPVVLSNGFAGSVDFFFASAVPVTPSTTYYFQTLVQSGDYWGITTRSDSRGDVNYPGGIFFGGLQPFTGNDLWFREGIVVPEPSSVWLFCLGSGVAGWFLRQKMRCLPSPEPLP